MPELDREAEAFTVTTSGGAFCTHTHTQNKNLAG